MVRAGASQRKIMLLALLPFVIWISAFELVPIARMLLMSFQDSDGQGLTLGHYVKGLSGAIYVQALTNSLRIALLSSVMAILVALLCAYSITRYTTRMRDSLLMLTNMIGNFAGVPLAFAFMILMGNNGVFTIIARTFGIDSFGDFDLYSELGLTLIYVYFQVPLAVMLLYPAYYGIREEWREAAAVLGASAFRFWRHIGIPMLLPSIVGTFGMLFANALGAYATAYALTGSIYNLLSIRISALVSGDIFPNFELGSALAVILAAIMLSAILLNEWMSRLSRRRGL
ncbi:ABC transporter permease [Paenibacillus xanthanilyticus]|uniref:ABC transporter permease n=1 Tax=Paenibacillus xanthanilyticus TaxID=1783531 RepID=A0ABV8K258_9BACL